MKNYIYVSCFLSFVSTLALQAQKSQELIETMKQHDKLEQTYKSSYYYNPSTMGDYNDYSTSEFSLNYNKEQKDLFLFQKGKSNNQVSIDINSYKKLSNNRTIWGSASYKNQVQKGVLWSNNVDIDLIGPYAMADSVANDFKSESYEFKGGYAKEINRWSLGVELGYMATMGYKKRDPRPKSVSSDMRLKGGVGYALSSLWKVDLSAGVHKYTQNTSVTFANQTQQAGLYQMQGLGTWNNYFSGKTTKAVYETFGYNLGVGLARKDDFLVAFKLGNDNMSKDVLAALGSSSDGYEINQLKNNYYSLMATKFFTLDSTSKIALKYQTQSEKKRGTDIYYTNNDTFLKKLMQKELYSYTQTSHLVEAFYRKQYNKSQLTLQPFWMYQSVKVSIKEVNKKQDLTYNYFGLKTSFLTRVNDRSTLELNYDLVFRNTLTSRVDLKTDQGKESINTWMENDLEYLKQNYIQNELAVKYSYKYEQLPPIFIALKANQVNFSNKKTNHYIGVSVGVNF
ncbi:DUF6850 family outer membrane beta-barrel protein [Myroides sp. N17-2]|uniref:DUF6850 family outer membrane beta-barrel protein n=1 Tax=Myroides sp. N17-2 TaxID=2030799 RepID=UPI0011807185|nr:DUF6850 family outer membrane beta-barrel protein [Myroides sp. N17-2]